MIEFACSGKKPYCRLLLAIEDGQCSTTTTAPADRFSAKRQVRVMAEILRINRIMRDTLTENINRGS